VTKVNIDMINSARASFAAEQEVQDGQIVELMEITMRNLLVAASIDLSDFLARADVLAAVGKTVLISDFFEYYRLAAYLNRYTSEPIAITMGVSSLLDLFKEQYYTELEGGILEAFGKLFTKDLRIYVYPMRDEAGVIRTSDTLEMQGEMRSLYRHLVERGKIKQPLGSDVAARSRNKLLQDHGAPVTSPSACGPPHECAVLQRTRAEAFPRPRVVYPRSRGHRFRLAVERRKILMRPPTGRPPG
jgi:hypothetical protein